MVDLLALDRAAVEINLALYDNLAPDDFDRTTPCAGWTVRDLLRHQVESSLDFVAGAHRTTPRPFDEDDLVAEFHRAAAEVADAFGAAGMLDREADFPGLTAMPGNRLVAAHFVDNLVHSWDLRRALGVDATLDEDLAGPAYRMALKYPYTPEVRGPGAFFAHPVPVLDTAPLTDRLVGLLGRDPS
ncbi:TIGR03086 family metal-binding protein [Saccharothrix violaceirubra]|uniref:Uncharacterized protein (TIGR03086 family) n=1 Tax=Saccharothrix violaceirubra TaxID=413306 RepID=A0A7W7WZM3_9PSEU|nr:TIGR03086 family metal-binding protein [Saccharothrix violaceirubra]MBB4969003.1 uncharacterized protein (TIGR03086 family) [Saccharothrix violaceirubra]